MTEVEQEFRIRVLLSVQRALLGEVTAKMRSIEVILATDTLHLRVWHEGAATKEEKDDFDAIVVTGIAADLWTGIEPPRDPTFEFVRCDPPAKPKTEGVLVFARQEQ